MAKTDDFAWLEGWGRDKAVYEWVAREHRATLKAFTTTALYQAIEAEVADSWSESRKTPVWVGSTCFWEQRQGGSQLLYRQAGPQGQPEVVFDLRRVGSGYVVRYWSVSPGGRFLAVVVSVYGLDQAEVRVYDLRTGRRRKVDTIKETQYWGFTWASDESSFYYTWGPDWEPDATTIYRHVLGTPSEQDQTLSDSPYLRGCIGIHLSADEVWLIVASFNRGLTDYVVAYHLATGEVRRVAQDLPAHTEAEIRDGQVYLVAPQADSKGNQVLAAPLDALPASVDEWRVVVRDRTGGLQRVRFAAEQLVIGFTSDRGEHLEMYDYDGSNRRVVPISPFSKVTGLGVSSRQTDFWYTVEGYVTPMTFYSYDAITAQFRFWWQESGDLSAEDYVVRAHWTRGEDGTRVPLVVIHHRSVTPGANNPVVLKAYGGYDLPQSPSYLRKYAPLLSRGVVVAIATLRGDGGRGQAWYLDGAGPVGKLNTFRDLLAVARFLRRTYTRNRLALRGGSSGGLTVTAATMMAPELFCAIVAWAPLTDMSIPDPDSHHRAEYGDPSDPAQWRLMRQWSPYQNIREGVRYPPQLVIHSASDQRVDAAHGWKYAARVKAAHPDNEVWVLSEFGAGHYTGWQDDPIEMTFLLQKLGVET